MKKQEAEKRPTTLAELFKGKPVMASLDGGLTYVDFNSLTEEEKTKVTDYTFRAYKK